MKDRYFIPHKNVEPLRKRFKTEEKRAKKLARPAIGCEFLESNKDGVWVKAFGHRSRLEGWHLVASVTIMSALGDEGQLASSRFMLVPGESIPPSFKLSRKCDACNTDRSRKYLYLVRNEDVYKQVGSDCLHDFLGGETAHSIAADAEILRAAYTILEEYEDKKATGGGKEVQRVWDISQLLQVAIPYYRMFGWTSGQFEMPNIVDAVVDFIDEKLTIPLETSSKDLAIAEKIILWGENLTHERKGLGSRFRLGFAIKDTIESILNVIPEFVKEDAKPKVNETPIQSPYISEEGEQVRLSNIDVYYKKAITHEDERLSTRFLGHCGDKSVCWFWPGVPKTPIPGARINEEGIVAAHMDWYGSKFTQLKDVQLVESQGSPMERRKASTFPSDLQQYLLRWSRTPVDPFQSDNFT